MKFLFLFLFIINISSIFAKEISLTNEEIAYLEKNQPLKLHNEMNWPPYNFNENGEPKGFSIDYMNLIAKKLNIDVEYISNKTWDEFMEMLKKDEIDAIINISKNKERSQYFDFTSVFHTAANAIYVQTGNESLDTLKKLEGKTIVMPKGFFAQQLLSEYYPNIKQIHVTDSVEALRMLSLGKADATVGKKNVLDYIIATKNISGVVATNYVDDSRLVSLIRIATSKNKPILNSILEKAQKSITDEEMLTLKRKWFGGSDFKVPNEFLKDDEKIYIKNKPAIKMCNLYDLRPIEFYEDSKVQGISIDILKKIEEKIGVQFISIKVDTLNEAKLYLQQGICDILPTVTKIDDLIDVSNFTKPVLSYKLAIVTQKGKPIVESLEDIINKPMAKKESSDFIKLLKSTYPDININETKSDYDTFEAVNSNKVYFAIEPLPLVSYYMSKYALNNIFISRYTNMYFTSSIAVSNNEPKLLEILNKALSEISENEHTEIFNKWTNVSIKEPFDYSLLWKIVSIIVLIIGILAYRQIILNKHNKKLQLANNKIEEKTIELAKQKELFEKLYSKSADGVLLIKNEKIVDSNEAAIKILGFDKEYLLNKKLSDLSPILQPDDTYSAKKANEKIVEALKNGICKFEWVHRSRFSENSWIEVVLTSIEIDNEPVIHAVIRDIDDRKKMEKELAILNSELENRINIEIKKNQEKTTQLIQQSRLAQMGEMISMIAHQWRQPLTAISATSSNLLLKLLIDQKIEKDTLKKELELVNDYSQHLSSTIDDFRNFFKTDKIKTNCKLEDLINKSLNIIKTSIESKNIMLNIDYKCNTTLNIYSTEIQQVILNLLKNAEDVLVDKSNIDRKIEIKTFKENNYAVIEISDNGGGIPEKILDKIFDPYFSTKKSKEGSGLGLYMSKTIVNEHCNGQLIAYNTEIGALFRVELPINENI